MTLQDTLKSKDTEEWIDLVFYRPIGYCWALLFKKINVTPNTVSILSIFMGILAGVLFYYSDLWLNVAGMILLVWANSYDSADGQLARMTGNYSRLGRLLDGLASSIWFVAIYVAICWRLMPVWGFYIWPLAVVSGYFHSKQAAMADYLRNFHLLFVKEKHRSELDDSAELEKLFQLLTWKKNFIEKLFIVFYVSYTKEQERWTPRLQAFRKTLAEQSLKDAIHPDNSTAASTEAVPLTDSTAASTEAVRMDELREAFRKASRPMMKYTNILSFNTRAIALFISLFVGFPWAYFLFELTVMNMLLIYMLYKYEAICEKFTFRLRGND